MMVICDRQAGWSGPLQSLTRGLLESEAELRELSAEFVFHSPGLQHDGPLGTSLALDFLRFSASTMGGFAELGSCCAWPLPQVMAP